MKLKTASSPRVTTGRLVLADGTVFEGMGFGATGAAVGEVCFNTAMTGYQEILSDPSYAGQIVTFTFPHIGNTGANEDDTENATDAAMNAARGAIVRADPTTPSNYRSRFDLSAWMARRGIVGLGGIDTRALTAKIREAGMFHAAIAHAGSGDFDIDDLVRRANAFPGLAGLDLSGDVTGGAPYGEDRGEWIDTGFEAGDPDGPHAVVIDYGVKRTILRRLVAAGCKVSVLPPRSSIEDVMALDPDGVVLSNGPGDPAATATHAVPLIRELLDRKVPTFGICLGHQLLALALGAQTVKMRQGHHGANHPVKVLETGKVEIVSMNHGFAVDSATLPERVRPTHTSLFDGSNAGLAVTDAPALSVQHHPEAGPGPQDSFPVFADFVALMAAAKAG